MYCPSHIPLKGRHTGAPLAAWLSRLLCVFHTKPKAVLDGRRVGRSNSDALRRTGDQGWYTEWHSESMPHTAPHRDLCDNLYTRWGTVSVGAPERVTEARRRSPFQNHCTSTACGGAPTSSSSGEISERGQLFPGGSPSTRKHKRCDCKDFLGSDVGSGTTPSIASTPLAGSGANLQQFSFLQ